MLNLNEHAYSSMWSQNKMRDIYLISIYRMQQEQN